MNEKALGYVLIFGLLTVFGKLPIRWYRQEIYRASDISWAEVTEYKRLRLRRKEPFMPVMLWLIKNSANPKETLKKIIFYYLYSAPFAVFTVISAIGLKTHIFDNLLDRVSVMIPLYMMIALLASITCRF